MQICIFEDEQYLNFEPLIYSRPVYDLVCGMTTLKEKIIRAFPKEKIVLKCRPYLESFVKAENPKCKVNQLKSRGEKITRSGSDWQSKAKQKRYR